MNRFGFMLLALSLPGLVGYAACCAQFDDAYPTYGGNWERVDRFHGRVGSAFSDASQSYASDETVVYMDEGEWSESEAIEGEMIEGSYDE